MDGPTDKSPGPFFDGPPDKSCGLRTPDPGPFFGTTVQRILTKNIARSKDLWPGPDDYPPRCGAKNIARPLGLYQA